MKDVDKKDDTELMKLIRKNSLTAEYHVTPEHDLNKNNEDGDTALTLAAREGRENIVKKLMKMKVHINHQNKNGDTALRLAVLNGNASMVEILLQEGADINLGCFPAPLFSLRSNDYASPLGVAVNEFHDGLITQFLIFGGANIATIVDSILSFHTPAWKQILEKNYEMTSKLVVIIKNRSSELLRSINNKPDQSEKIIDDFIKSAENKKIDFKNTKFNYPRESELVPAVCNFSYLTHLAVLTHNPTLLEALLKHGLPDLSSSDARGKTALQLSDSLVASKTPKLIDKEINDILHLEYRKLLEREPKSIWKGDEIESVLKDYMPGVIIDVVLGYADEKKLKPTASPEKTYGTAIRGQNQDTKDKII